MNKFKVGVNFDFDLLEKIIDLNKSTEKGMITELYGSDRAHSKLAARPGFRLPDITSKEFERYVSIAKENKIDFNYTLNSFNPYGSKNCLYENVNEVVDFIKYLESVGVYRLTIANPILLEIIRNYAHSDIEIEISTCAHIDTITQIKYYHDKYGVNKICGNLNKNRDFKFLKAASNYCNENGIIYELMVNEFCGVGGNNYATHCIYRDSCYVCHATNETLEDSMTFDNYPMELCTKSRNENPSNWLKLRWIRPEDLKYYNAIGLEHFKVTGRTGSTEYITGVLRAYLEEEFDGNLLNLWKPLESINKGVSEAFTSYYIDNKKLDKFIMPWTINKNCDYEVCGETCTYCNDFYKALEVEE